MGTICFLQTNKQESLTAGCMVQISVFNYFWNSPCKLFAFWLLFRGVWNGKRIISEQWIHKCADSYPGNAWLNNWDDHCGMKGYGYAWWTHTFLNRGNKINMFHTAGWGGQYIMVIPQLNTVVVFTSGNYTSYRPPFEIFKKYILPVLK